MLISRGDSDHTNGVEELIERQDIGVRIGTLVLPVQEVWDEALKGLAEKALANGTHVAVIEAGQNIEVLKVAHHGSKNSSSEEFLRQVKPEYFYRNAAA